MRADAVLAVAECAPSGLTGRESVAASAILHRLHSPDVRALAALVTAPSLIDAAQSPFALLDDAWRATSLARQASWLARLDRDPEALLGHLARSNARPLGRYTEALWHFWFMNLPDAKVHAAGIAITDGGNVRGELDFVVSLPGLEGVQHLEMGYKFFLHCPPGRELARFVGTDPEDRLDRKWRHMVDVQLPLSQTSLARAALPAGLAASRITPRACLQGHVFHPLDKEAIAGHGETLLWCRHDPRTLPAWVRRAPAWWPLPKRAWIAPAQVDASTARPERLLSAADCARTLREHFAHSAQAQLVAGLVPCSDGAWRESMRVLVVAANWRGAAPGNETPERGS